MFHDLLRYAYIYNQVLNLYRNTPEIKFPIDPCEFLHTSNCRVMTYEEFSKLNHISVSEVIGICESKSGCTHYEASSNRYLVLWNSSKSENNVLGRQRWTKAHELGHITLKHLPDLKVNQLAENQFNNLDSSLVEREADFFSSTFLSPLPLFPYLNINSPDDIHRMFGLSFEASKIRWEEYLTWHTGHRKTAWENDIRRLFLEGKIKSSVLHKPQDARSSTF